MYICIYILIPYIYIYKNIYNYVYMFQCVKEFGYMYTQFIDSRKHKDPTSLGSLSSFWTLKP